MCRLSGSVSRDRRLVVLPVMMVVLLSACASGGAGGGTGPAVTSADAEPIEVPTHVVVNNRSWDQVTVFLTFGTVEWRLGEVEPMTERTLPLKHMSRAVVGRTVQLMGRRLAGGSLRSEGFDVNPGGGVPTWTIENNGAFSFVLLR
jgi:hypothetical protein